MANALFNPGREGFLDGSNRGPGPAHRIGGAGDIWSAEAIGRPSVGAGARSSVRRRREERELLGIA